MAEDEGELRKRIKEGMVLDQGEGPVASPSVPYIEYILEDEYKPSDLPPDLVQVAYDKEMALSNLREDEIKWLRMQLMRSEINFVNSRPALAGNYNEEIKLSVLPAKLLIKLARSRGGFERKQQTTQTIIRRAEISGGERVQKRRWRIFGRKG